MNDTTLRECKSNHFETFQNEIETNFNYSAPYNNLKSEILQITYLTLPPPEKAVKRRALLIQPQKCIKHTKISLWNTKQKNRPKEAWKMYSKAVSFKFGTFGDLYGKWEIRSVSQRLACKNRWISGFCFIPQHETKPGWKFICVCRLPRDYSWQRWLMLVIELWGFWMQN